MYERLRRCLTPGLRTFGRWLFPLLVVSFIEIGGTVTAAGDGPSVQSLLDLCERGAAQGGKGVEAAGCEWLAAPCACKLRTEPGEGAPWCVPEDVTIDEQARAVIAALRRLPDKSVLAEEAVSGILGRLYPCPAGPGR